MRAVSAIVATSLAFVVQATAEANAATWGGSWGIWKSPNWLQTNGGACMTDGDAQTVANNFESLIANYSDALANKTLTTNFHDYTDSVIELINSGCPNGPVPVSSYSVWLSSAAGACEDQSLTHLHLTSLASPPSPRVPPSRSARAASRRSPSSSSTCGTTATP